VSLPVDDRPDVELAVVERDSRPAVQPQVSESGRIAGQWLKDLEVLGDLTLGSSGETQEVALPLGDLAMQGLQLVRLHLTRLNGRGKPILDFLPPLLDVLRSDGVR
jgi:hypothetical protein